MQIKRSQNPATDSQVYLFTRSEMVLLMTGPGFPAGDYNDKTSVTWLWVSFNSDQQVTSRLISLPCNYSACYNISQTWGEMQS